MAKVFVIAAVLCIPLIIYYVVSFLWRAGRWLFNLLKAPLTALGTLFTFLCRGLAPLSGLGRLVGYLLTTIPCAALYGVASICTGVLGGALGMGSTVASGLFGALGVGASWLCKPAMGVFSRCVPSLPSLGRLPNFGVSLPKWRWPSLGKWGSGLRCRNRKPAPTKKNVLTSQSLERVLSKRFGDPSKPPRVVRLESEKTVERTVSPDNNTPQPSKDTSKDLSQAIEDTPQAIEDISQPSEDSTKVVATAEVSKYIREGALNAQTDMAKSAVKNAAATAFRAVANAKVAADDALDTRTVLSVCQFIQRVIITNKEAVASDCKRFDKARKQCEELSGEENTIQLVQNFIDLRDTLRKASCVMEHALQAHNEYIATEKAKCQAKCANAKRWESQSKANAPVMVNEVKNWTEGTSAEEPKLDSSTIALRDQFMNGDCNSDFVKKMLSRMSLHDQQNCKMEETLTNQHFRKWFKQHSKEYGLYPSDALEPIGSDQAGEGVGL
jgi:hypothetical protein